MESTSPLAALRGAGKRYGATARSTTWSLRATPARQPPRLASTAPAAGAPVP